MELCETFFKINLTWLYGSSLLFYMTKNAGEKMFLELTDPVDGVFLINISEIRTMGHATDTIKTKIVGKNFDHEVTESYEEIVAALNEHYLVISP